MTVAPALLITALVVAAAPPQGGPQATFTSRVESVRLDVLVTDNGRPVPGLAAGDFEVRDNGELQKATLIGADARPLDVTLALDMSSSLRAERLQALLGAGDALLEALENDDRSGLVAFSEAVERRQALTSGHELTRRALRAVTPSGATSLIDAMYTAIAMTEPGDRRNLLIVFSDGVDTASWLPAEAVVLAARRSDTVVYAVTTAGVAETPALLREVTAATGGQVLAVDSSSLASAFTRILDEFRQRYLLSYTLRNQPRPGWHRLDVRVRRPGADVKTRSGYEVPVR